MPASIRSVLHYLKAVEAVKCEGCGEGRGLDEGERRPTTRCSARASIREDGRKIHDAFLLEVKKPEESKGEWDLLKSSPRFRPTRPSVRWTKATARW